MREACSTQRKWNKLAKDPEKKELALLTTILLAVFAVGFVLFILAVVVIVLLFKKGLRFMTHAGRRRRYSSSGWHHRPYGHNTYGHHHYRGKYSSRSGFFSS